MGGSKALQQLLISTLTPHYLPLNWVVDITVWNKSVLQNLQLLVAVWKSFYATLMRHVSHSQLYLYMYESRGHWLLLRLIYSELRYGKLTDQQ